LTPVYPPPPPALGLSSARRATWGALSIGTLGLSVGLVAGTALTFEPDSHPHGWTAWRRQNFTMTTLVCAVATSLATFGGWRVGSTLTPARPACPAPRCAIAAYDDAGYPIYEEEVRELTTGRGAFVSTVFGLGAGALAGAVLHSVAESALPEPINTSNDPSGVGVVAMPSVVPASLAAGVFVANCIGTELDRDAAIEQLRTYRNYQRLGR